MPDPQPANPRPASRPVSPTRRRRKRGLWMPQKQARRQMKRCAGDASALLQEALPITIKLSENAGIPGLKIGLDALLTILMKIETMRTNIEGVETLKMRVGDLTDTLKKCPSQPRDKQFEDIRRRLNLLCKKLSEAAANAEGIRSRGIIKRFFTSNSDATRLQGLVEDINTAIQDFVTQTVLSIDENVYVVCQDVKAMRTHLETSLLSTYAKRAQYNSGDSQNIRRECLEGTREEVLADAYHWIHHSSVEVASCAAEEKSGHILWINGGAGTGKTTIACSIAKKYNDEGALGANFFCSHSDARCRDPNLIFVTIARQLSQYYEPFKEKVVAILKQNPDVVNANPLEQFKALILRPLRELKGVFPTCVIVIDALDECQNGGLKSVILDVLARYIRDLAPFLFVITSRPEPHITTFFGRANELSLQDSTKPLDLNNVRLELTRHDIRRVLVKGFCDIRDVFVIKEEWPSNRDINKLTELSDGLFIFATTVLRFIGDPDHGNPKKQLRALLAAPASIMYDLYHKILKLAYKKVRDLHKVNPSLRHVLGAITLAEEPMSASALADLLDMSEGDVRNTLSRLHSVLHIPHEGSQDAIRFIHPTFPEFLLDASVNKPEAFRIEPAEHHLAMFSRSIKAMNSLKRNIAGIEKVTSFKSEIYGLSDTVKKCIPAHVAYACRFWSIHLSQCTPRQESLDLLSGFLTRQMLYWFEACSLLRVLDGALTALETTKNTCETLGGSFASLVALLVDFHRFLWTYYYCINAAPLEVYHSALALAPTESLVRRAYARELPSSFVVLSGALTNWPPRRDETTGHDGKVVYAIAFSPSADRFVTGGWDYKLEMRKTSTRTMLWSFDGYMDNVCCVAFSPDGEHVASGSDDRDVCVWQVSSGKCVRILKGHTSWVYSVAYSADGHRLLSATNKGEVKLWDTADWRCILTLQEAGNWTWQTGLSPDGGCIARGSGVFLSLYDVSSDTEETIYFSESVHACTFSTDGHFVAARAPHIIRVWRCADRTLVRSIYVRDRLSSRLAFSSDGTQIVCGSESGSVYLWLITSEEPPLVLQGHTGNVLDVSCSSEGLQVASASHDGTIRVSDVAPSTVRAAQPAGSKLVHPRSPQFALARHEGDTVLVQLPSVDSVAFQLIPEGAPALTPFAELLEACDAALQVSTNASKIARTRAWALITGQQHIDLSAATHSSQPVRISPDGSLLAYRSPISHAVANVCSLRTGKIIALLAGHTDRVLSLAFSPDGALIATGSVDHSAKVWNATTGHLVCSHERHTDWARALTFSSDSRLVASGSYDRSVHVFEATTGCVHQVFDGHRDCVMEIVFIAEDKRVLTLDYSDWIYIWDMATGARLYDLSLHDDSWIHLLDFSPDGAAILTGGGHHEVRTPSRPMQSSPSWPVYAVSKHGWVYAKSPGRTVRLCWLPPGWRSLPAWNDAAFHCLDIERKAVVTLDVSYDPEYVRAWGTSG